MKMLDTLFTALFIILLYHPTKSLAKSSAAKVPRWIIALSSYTYTIVHRSAKMISHADLLSRIPSCDSDPSNSDCLLIQPLPVKRDALVADTKRYFAPIFLHCVVAGHSKNDVNFLLFTVAEKVCPLHGMVCCALRIVLSFHRLSERLFLQICTPVTWILTK
ncbi:hypothetical protein CLF_100218 [Clonorchis sinensis]|uniref:Secreted protein n=1 Tax=Clonorchis sinensis TaxID=79923 RepID=G7Y2Z6_CLOSI|nr:hypothetical protein CLF_100218 [Clonorchis sinensis]